MFSSKNRYLPLSGFFYQYSVGFQLFYVFWRTAKIFGEDFGVVLS
jgi:hypothetical protein